MQAFCLPAFLQAKKSVEEAHRRQALPFHLHVPIAIQFHNFSHDLLWAWNQRPEPFHNEPLDVICYQSTLLLHIHVQLEIGHHNSRTGFTWKI